MTMSRFHEMVWQTVAMIPWGKVATYGQVARLCGYPGHARYVGQILKKLPANTSLPWHRVLNAKGEIALTPDSEAYHRQRVLLDEENICFTGGRVQLSRYQWDGFYHDEAAEKLIK